MRDRVFLTASPASTRSPVVGQMPPFARVAAMTEADSVLTSTEHSWNQTYSELLISDFIRMHGLNENIHVPSNIQILAVLCFVVVISEF